MITRRIALFGAAGLALPLLVAGNQTATRAWVESHLYGLIVQHPALNQVTGYVTGPIVKHQFNAPPKPGAEGPAPLRTDTIEAARRIMVEHFKPDAGRVLVAICGAGATTVHAFVVSAVGSDGRVAITQAIAQTLDAPEDYRGAGGKVKKVFDRIEHNAPKRMSGVLVEDWVEYATRSKRNSIVVLGLQTTPARAHNALVKLAEFVGRPYDPTMLAADPPTQASTQAFYCTEISAWFINLLVPGTIKLSVAGVGYPVYQVIDHMRATTLHGGPLEILYNGQNRLDVAALDPHPRD